MHGYIHPTALVESRYIGAGTRIWAFTHVMKDVIVGAECNIGSHCYLESGAKIGNRVTVKNGNYLWDGITICDGAFIGPQVAFTNDKRPRSPRLPCAATRYATDAWLSPTRVEEGASIGAAAVVVPGISLGQYCMVAAGSVVTTTVPPHALVIGIPARIVGWVCCCGEKLPNIRSDGGCLQCRYCPCEFKYTNGQPWLQSNPAENGTRVVQSP
ncbi:MAG: N-acetyltransferase [Acidobacteria bacterium]|nr:N-acetyltransferase [Acidobacteriota bacterium]